MRHRWSGRKLGRTASHRLAMLRNLATDFLDKEKIVTTVPKAKELRPFAEKLITLAKRETLHARRQALSVIRRKSVVHKLFDSLGPRFADRNGGYTRIIRLGTRRGDGSELALIELIGSEEKPAPETGKKKGKEAKAAAEKKSRRSRTKTETKVKAAKAKAKAAPPEKKKPAAKKKKQEESEEEEEAE